jgi:hypothetical protein
LFADGAEITEILFPGAVSEETEFVLQPNFQVKSRDIMPLILQEFEGDGTVYSARGEYGYFHTLDGVSDCYFTH